VFHVRKLTLLLATCLALAVLSPSGAVAGPGNPNGTGPPSQECEAIVEGGGTEPGKAAGSPGSPFKEEGLAGEGGTGGEHYSEKSQYDVACYHVSQHH
jgi:hypothetical protein